MRKSDSRLICALLALLCVPACLGAVSGIEGSGAAVPVQTQPKREAVVECVAAYAEPVPELASPEPEPEISAYDAALIAKTLYGECRGCDRVEQAAVAWCILNRADSGGQSVEQVVTSPGQFMGYSSANPVDESLYALAHDVLRRHALEAQGEENVGRVLPREYKWFSGDGRRNYFRNSYTSGQMWDWSLPNPYIET